MVELMRAAIAVGVGLAFTAPATASTITFTSTIDLANLVTSTPNEIYGPGTPITSQIVTVGDDVKIRYDFGGAGVSASDVNFAWAYVYTADGQPPEKLSLTGTFAFLDQAGHSVFTSSLLTGDEEFVHIGQQFDLTTGPLTFYAVEYDGHLNSADPSDPRSYDEPWLELDGSGFRTISAVTPVPASLPLFISGLACIGIAGWRRRATIRPA